MTHALNQSLSLHRCCTNDDGFAIALATDCDECAADALESRVRERGAITAGPADDPVTWSQSDGLLGGGGVQVEQGDVVAAGGGAVGAVDDCLHRPAHLVGCTAAQAVPPNVHLQEVDFWGGAEVREMVAREKPSCCGFAGGHVVGWTQELADYGPFQGVPTVGSVLGTLGEHVHGGRIA